MDVLVNTAQPPGGAGGAGASTSGALPRGTPVRLLPPGDKSGVPMVVTFSINQVRERETEGRRLARPTSVCAYEVGPQTKNSLFMSAAHACC